MGNRAHVSKVVASSWLSLVVASGCQLLMIPIALAALDEVDFALYAIIAQLLVAVMLAEVGVRSASARLLIDARADGQAAYDRMWTASVCVFCVQGLVMFLLIFGLAPFIGDIFHLDADQRALAFGIFLASGIIKAVAYMLSIFSTALMAGQKLDRVNIVTTAGSVAQLVGFVIAIWLGAGLWAYPISLTLAVVIYQPMLILEAHKHGLIGEFSLKNFEMQQVKVVFKLGFDVFVAAVFAVVMGNSLLIFSGHLLTLQQTAILAVNLKLVSLITQILQRIPGSAAPMMMKMVSEGKDQPFRVWWNLITKVTIASALLLAGLFVLWNRLVVTAWTSESMVMAVGPAILIALIPFRYLVHYQFVNSLTIFKEVRRVKWWLFWEIGLYAALAVIMSHRFGLNGLLGANLVSMLGGSLIAGTVWFSRYAEIPVRKLLTLLVQTVVPLSAAFCLVGLVGGWEMDGNVWAVLGLSALWGLCFALIGYYVILDDGERGKLRILASGFRMRLSRS